MWLDKNLAKIFKEKNDQGILNEELEKFFNDQRQDISINTEVTLDSYPEIQTLVQSLGYFENEINDLLVNLSSLENILVDRGIDIFYDSDDFSDSDDEYFSDDDNSCDRLSAFFGAFNSRLEIVEEKRKDMELQDSLEKDFCDNKMEQIRSFYNLDDKEIEKYKSNQKQLVEFLLSHINNNKDIVDFLHYHHVTNRLGKPYTKASIAKKRYLLKKI